MAFIASRAGRQAVPELRQASGFAPFAWYRIVAGVGLARGARGAGWL